VGILAVAGLAVIWSRSELEQTFRVGLTMGVALLVILLMLVWLVLLSGFSWKFRLLTLALLAVMALAGRNLLRVDGTVNGTGLPRLAWKWSPVPPLPAVAPAKPSPDPKTASAAPRPDIPDVPQFFGVARDGQIRNVGLATNWTAAQPKQLWRQPIGLGWSAFAVVKGRAYTQEQRGEDEWISCYALLTGELLWAHTNHTHFSQWQGGDGPRATPTITQSNVFAYGATGILDCLDADSGERVWSRDVLHEHGLPNLIWGASCSPLVYQDTVVVSGGLTNGPSLIAYDRATGKPLWTAGHDKASYSSPTLARLAGREVVLSVNAGSVTAHDAGTGKDLLEYPFGGDGFPKASQPVVLDEHRVFISAGYGVGCALLDVQAGTDGALIAKTLWKNKMLKTQFNSAALRDGFLYGLDDGLMACVEAASGKRQWKDGRYGSGQSLLVGDVLLVQSEPGAVALVQANPDGYRELARWSALSSKTWNYPTLAGRYLLVRNDRAAVCYELPVMQVRGGG
jgi:outer membrane protein assembly factor BamB